MVGVIVFWIFLLNFFVLNSRYLFEERIFHVELSFFLNELLIKDKTIKIKDDLTISYF